MVNSQFVISRRYYICLNPQEVDYDGFTFNLTFRNAKFRIGGDGQTWYSVTGTDSIVYLKDEIYRVVGGIIQDRFTLPSTYTTLEVVGQLYITNITDYSLPNVKLLVSRAIENPISIKLHIYIGEINLVDKGVNSYEFFDSTREFYGQFTEQIDVLNPSILIQGESLFAYNYCEIDTLARKYFIVKITNVRKGLWRLDCHVDVLYTYNTDIREQSAYIERNESNPYNVKIADDRWTFSTKPTYTFTNVTGGTLHNITLDVNLSATKYAICFSVLNDNGGVGYSNIASLITGLPNINAGNFQNALAVNYAITPALWSGLARDISQQQTLASFVFNVNIYPFDFADANLYDPTSVNIWIGSTDTTKSGYNMIYDLSPHLIIADFKLPSYVDFRDVEPYKECSLIIPYYNNIFTFNLKRSAGHRILVYYTTQFSTGESNVFVYDYDDGKILLCAPVQLATKMAVSTTNLHEITIERIQTGIGAINNSFDSWFKMLSSGAGGNIIGGLAGVQKWSKGIVDLAMAEDILQDTAVTQNATGVTGVYNPQQCILITKELTSLVTNANIFHAKNGYPIQAWDVLDDGNGHAYTGYTEMSELHYIPDIYLAITKPEIEEIERLAKEGIIL